MNKVSGRLTSQQVVLSTILAALLFASAGCSNGSGSDKNPEPPPSDQSQNSISAPVLSGTSPASPAPQTEISLIGTAGPNERISVFASSDCSGPMLAEGSADSLGAFQILLQVNANSTSEFSAASENSNGIRSACSSQSLSFVSDLSAPEVPQIIEVSSNNTLPTTHATIMGRAEPGTIVRIYSNSTCTTEFPMLPLQATSEEGRFRVTVSPLPAESNQTFYAKSFDAANNVSACSNPRSFVTAFIPNGGLEPAQFISPTITAIDLREPLHSFLGPLEGPALPFPITSERPVIHIKVESNRMVDLFEGANCQGSPLETRRASSWGRLAIQTSVPTGSKSFSIRAEYLARECQSQSPSGGSGCVDATRIACSPTVTYTNRGAPLSPQMHDVAFSPTSASENPAGTYSVLGWTSPFAAVYLYRDENCRSAPVGLGQASGDGSFVVSYNSLKSNPPKAHIAVWRVAGEVISSFCAAL